MFGGEESDKKVKVLSGGERSRLAMIRLLLEPVNLLILDEPTNHLDMPSKDVLKEAIKAFDGTAIIVSHDREFLDGLVTKVYEFGGGKVREHLGGIYDFLRSKKISDLNQLGKETNNSQRGNNSFPTREQNVPNVGISSEQLAANQDTLNKALSYAERKEQQKRKNRVEKAVKQSETKIEQMEQRLKELDELLMVPENAADMTLVTEYTSIKRALDEEVERWEKLSEELDTFTL
jgi:ATP-binding cassette subfamily F protein 3